MKRNHNKKLVPRAKDLRGNMTKEENDLWFGFLKDYPVKFRRQKVIGNYIADFYCAKAKLVIEVDGFQHELDPDVVLSDEEKTAYFSKLGIYVLRFKNSEISKTNLPNVYDMIDKLVKSFLKDS